MPRHRSGAGDLVTYFLTPYLAATAVFSVLVWARDPTRFGQTWSIGIVAGAVIGIFAFLGYLGHTRRVRVGPWHNFL